MSKEELIKQAKALAEVLQKASSKNAAALKAFRKVFTAAEILETEWGAGEAKPKEEAQSPKPKA